MKEGEAGSLVEGMGKCSIWKQFFPGNSDSCKVTLGFYTRSGYKQHIPWYCLNLDRPSPISRKARMNIQASNQSKKISVTFRDSDNGVYGEFLSSVHLFRIRS